MTRSCWHSRILLIVGVRLILLATVIPSRAVEFVDGAKNCTVIHEEKLCRALNSMNPAGHDMMEASHTKHVMVLVHGIMGNHKELAYVKQALEREFVAATTAQESFLVHTASSNDHNTLDGIEAGGRRLAEEINTLLKDLSHQKETLPVDDDNTPASTTRILLSILGNSLGGLYARYALAHIQWNHKESDKAQEESHDQKNYSVPIIPHIFVTTATPHLGVRDHTYWKLPSSFQPAGAWSLKKSGSDLFRYTDMVRQLCQEEQFLYPLSNFTKRIAYANAFSTDAAVPTSTAAFLSDSSPSVHHLVREPPPSSPKPDQKAEHTTLFLHVNSDYPTIRFQTPVSFSEYYNAMTYAKSSEEKEEDDDDDNVESYAKALDSLGWTKVFVDVRSHIPALWNRGRRRDDLNVLVNEQRQEYTSIELKERLSTFDYNTLPFGHSFLVASAKNSIYTWFYRGGRPLVDRIAKELVQEMKAGSQSCE